MNNSQLTLSEENPQDISPMLRERQQKIAGIIQAVTSISQSEYWKLLEREVFGVSLSSAINQLCVERDDRKVAQLQGKIEILEKYADIGKLGGVYKIELKGIEEKLKGR